MSYSEVEEIEKRVSFLEGSLWVHARAIKMLEGYIRYLEQAIQPRAIQPKATQPKERDNGGSGKRINQFNRNRIRGKQNTG
jgi:hypothetical protein